MKNITRHYRKLKLTYIISVCAICMLMAVAFPWFRTVKDVKYTYYMAVYNGVRLGNVADGRAANMAFLNARRRFLKESGTGMYLDCEFVIYEEDRLTGEQMSSDELEEKIYGLIGRDSIKPDEAKYVVDINGHTLTLNSISEVEMLLNAAKGKFDGADVFHAELTEKTDRFVTYGYNMVKADTEDKASQTVMQPAQSSEAGGEVSDAADKGDGVQGIEFSENIKVVRSYASAVNMITVEDAISEVTKEKEKNQTYTVVAGDTISKIAKQFELTTEDLLAMNNNIKENDIIHIGDEITVMVPTPEISVIIKEQKSYREEYSLPVQYVYNDNKYSTYAKTLDEGKSGIRDVTAVVSVLNGQEISREIRQEDIVEEASAKVVEVGTLTPPTFIKPVSGGTVSSPYGWRTLYGRRDFHLGIDWSLRNGTSVRASCAGTVIKAGWGGSYGYQVLIRHADGSQTRYAHLSRVLVKVGQKVAQNEKIALSGNTGNSTGPHLHFEVIINGSTQNPTKYIK